MICIKVNLIFDYITVKIIVSMFFGIQQGRDRIAGKICGTGRENTVR